MLADPLRTSGGLFSVEGSRGTRRELGQLDLAMTWRLTWRTRAASPTTSRTRRRATAGAWGSNRQILNNLIVLGTAYDISGTSKYRTAVLEGVDYRFGRNALNHSYVTGYGTAFSQNQQTRLYAHQLDPALPHPPPGAISGGPNWNAGLSGSRVVRR